MGEKRDKHKDGPRLVDKIGVFTAIPNTVIRLLPQVGPSAFALWSYLRMRMNSETEVAFPAYETIRAETGLGFDTIARSCRALEAAGLIERRRRFSSSTVYTLKLPNIQSSEKPSNGASSHYLENPSNGASQYLENPSPVLGKSESSTWKIGEEQDSFIKIETNKKTASGASAPGGRARTERQRVTAELEKAFSSLTQLPLPSRNTEKEKRAANVRWWSPLWSLYADLADCNLDSATKLMRDAVNKMRAERLTVSSPQSISEVALSLFAERKASIKIDPSKFARQVYQ